MAGYILQLCELPVRTKFHERLIFVNFINRTNSLKLLHVVCELVAEANLRKVLFARKSWDLLNLAMSENLKSYNKRRDFFNKNIILLLCTNAWRITKEMIKNISSSARSVQLQTKIVTDKIILLSWSMLTSVQLHTGRKKKRIRKATKNPADGRQIDREGVCSYM